ncbi:MAG TPA: alanine--tRNA ligase [Gemmatimonadaceae bacterium]|nr:alanine--tRNA ligase [Gemmatimonadaceae bacterium]
MQSSEIRTRFLEFFERQGHRILPSSSLVPTDDPTLLFTNAGMVQFKRVFLGNEEPPTPTRRATTSQKCVRAGGKHNDLEQVGHTARHHTFFEMLGNFSFGDYFKREAIGFAWEFVTRELGLAPENLRVTVFREDDEARALWKEIAGLPDTRVFGLGEKDNFWQMADTGPCGPCTEIYVDLAKVARDWKAPAGSTGSWTNPDVVDFDTETFVEAAEAGRFVEIWNLVFMQFDRQPDGTLAPLPRPSVDTGAGLERIAAVMQGVANNFDTDLFTPLIASVQAQLGSAATSDIADRVAATRVIADHARSIAFLLADGVYPSNDGRGYVLRRILRRGVRYAWLLGRREPTLTPVVERVIDMMRDVYPELHQRRQHILDTTRAEEERFLATINGGMQRFDELAPAKTTQERTIAGEDAFKLYDTYGFPIDLTELMARERDYTVDIPGFERALAAQRTQSQEERRSRKLGVAADDLGDANAWSDVSGSLADALASARFVGYERVDSETDAIAVRPLSDGRVAVLLRESPFYAESGGQVSDDGVIVGEGWRVAVDDVRKLEGKPIAIGKPTGNVTRGTVRATVPRDVRLDTQRNHTATHLLHAALRETLGDHVHQAGSLVAPDRLRFDFTHTGPLTREQVERVEEIVNRGILAAVPVTTTERPYEDAVSSGAMALFGEKYGDVVRVVDIPSLSRELCGGTHVGNTAGIGLFSIVSESGIAAGVRRIEAITGTRAYEAARDREKLLGSIAEAVKATPATVLRRVQTVVDERRALEKRVSELMRGGGGGTSGPVQQLLDGAVSVNGLRLVAREVASADAKSLQELAEAARESASDVILILVSAMDGGKNAVIAAVGDVARERGARADVIVKTLAQEFGGRGGGKPALAQGGVPTSDVFPALLARAEAIVSEQIA